MYNERGREEKCLKRGVVKKMEGRKEREREEIKGRERGRKEG